MRIELFPLEEDLEGLESGFGREDPEQQLALAWALRQSQGARSLALLEALAPVLDRHPAWRARALTIQAEQAQLHLQPQQAQSLSEQAQRLFASSGDLVGVADALLPLMQLAYDADNAAQGDALLERFIALSEQAGDSARALHGRLVMGCQWIYRDRGRADAAVAGLIPEKLSDAHTMLAATMAQYQAMRATQLGDMAAGVRYFVLAHHAAMASGQLRRAIMSCCSAAYCFGQLRDPSHALEWVERGLELAGDTGWVGQIANCRFQVGECLCLLGRLDAARELLEEVLRSTAAHPGLRVVAQAQGKLAWVLIQQGEAARAAQLYQHLCERAAINQQFDTEVEALDGLAQAQLALGAPEQARATLQRCLTLARQHAYASGQLMALSTLAELERQQGRDGHSALSALQEAEQLTQQGQGPALTPALLAALADAHAAQGQHAEAFEAERRARLTAEAQASDEAQLRAMAMQAHFQGERLSQENEHLRQLAKSNAERIAALSSAHETLITLGRIGQEITAALQPDVLFERLDRHLRVLLEVNAFTVYSLDQPAQLLTPLYAMEDHRPLQARRIPLDSPVSFCAACVRQRELLLVEGDGITPSASQIPGASPMGSLMFAPLQVGDRLIGVLSLQARRPRAYGEREIAIFRSLCAYVAVALDNALAYANLGQLQRRLAEQERLASLGSLVAGVAHELNTPVGNSLLAASTLQDALHQLQQQLGQQQLRRSDLLSFMEQSEQALELVLNSMRSASALVSGFKELAVTREPLQRGSFQLDELCRASLGPLTPRFMQQGIALHLDLPSHLRLDSYPAALSQALSILLDNALVHAFEAGQSGEVWLRAGHDGERLWLQVRDNGRGIHPSWHARVFEPFVTSRFGHGGNGLGLAVARNLVHGVLGGELSLHSDAGAGTEFRLLLPVQAPG